MARRRGYYRQFEALTEEEVNVGKREQAAERKRLALARQEPLDLTRTTWPEYPPHVIVNAITFAARRGLHRYRDRHATELRAAIAHRHGVDGTQVVVGDGAAQLLAGAARELLGEGDELVTPWPSYTLYPLMARRARASAVPVAGFDVDALLAAVNGSTRIICVCNPNDPTGELLATAELDRLLSSLPERVVVLIDEALRDFATAEPVDATVALLERHPRLLLFRTFSKAWGLAGLRVGYALGGVDAGPLLEQLEPELGLDELAQAGALEALTGTSELAGRRGRQIAERRVALAPALRALGYALPESEANVLWLGRTGISGAELSARLERGGIRVAGGGPLGDPDRVRLTVPHVPAGVERVLRAAELAT